MRVLFKKQLIVVVSFFVLIGLLVYAGAKNKPQYISLKEYEKFLQNNQIAKAKIIGDEVIIGVGKDEFSMPKEGVDIALLLQEVPVSIESGESVLNEILYVVLLGFVLFVLILFLRLKKVVHVEPNARAKRASEEEIINQNDIKAVSSNITFDDVAGIQSAKDELFEIVEFLKNPSKYKEFGIKLPRGVLLVGPPGVGKTMVAKAVAGEAGVPFFYQSGATFVQIYVGMGAKRVRELFAKAKANSPSIIFIDEIDSVGKARGGMRNDEREATLNQLLTEIDGFEDNSGVIVIGATNKIEMIDEALLRSGRFDRRVFLSMPDVEDRKKILLSYLEDKKHSVHVDDIARVTVGFSGASLATLVNESAINALRRESKIIENSDFYAVKEKVLFGKHRILSFNDDEKKVQAYYQGAKALSAYWYDVEFDKIGIVGDSLKSVEREIESKTQILSKIKVHLSGIASSNIFFNESYSNAKEDIFLATNLARVMILELGMGQTLYSSESEVAQVLKDTLAEVENFLAGMRENIELIAQVLIEKESIDKEDIRKIVFKGE